MKILVDMNLSPSWVGLFRQENWEAVHWSSIGSATASDGEILGWAAENDYIVFTHDLDFGVQLASRARRKPSVIQLRTLGNISLAHGADCGTRAETPERRTGTRCFGYD